LQLFALVSPLFFQVVVDKVLVHRTLGTLDVLIIGLVAIAIFETVLGILRTYLFAHRHSEPRNPPAGARRQKDRAAEGEGVAARGGSGCSRACAGRSVAHACCRI
jgi:hypothetical protein